MSGTGATKYLWNMTLLQDVISRAYVEVLKFGRSLVMKNKLSLSNYYHNIWPYKMPGNEPFQLLMQCVLNTCRNHKLLYSKQNSGMWVRWNQAIVYSNDINSNNSSDDQKDSSNNESNNKDDKMTDILLEIGLPIVELPNNQLKVLVENAEPSPTQLSSS